jgi:hypothetical protein
VIDGGGGVNTLDYFQYTTGVNADLAAGTATGTGGISNIQNVTGGIGSDTLAGDEADNILLGGAGDDTLTGGAGQDSLDGSEGNDTLVESRDADFTLTNSTLTIGSEGADTITEIENIEPLAARAPMSWTPRATPAMRSSPGRKAMTSLSPGRAQLPMSAAAAMTRFREKTKPTSGTLSS